jgi:hypothetical protein
VNTRARPTFTVTTFRLWSALLAWAAYFLLVYVAIALACERGFADLRILGVPVVPAVTGGTFLVAFGVTGAFAAAAHRRERQATTTARRFLEFVTCVLGMLALAAIAWTTLPPVLLDTGCA